VFYVPFVAIQKIKNDTTIDRLKTNLVEAGDKVNRTNDGLLEQLRKFVEQKSLLESKRILNSIDRIESILLEVKDSGVTFEDIAGQEEAMKVFEYLKEMGEIDEISGRI